MSTLTNWKPYSQKVDNSSGLGEGRFLAANFLMIAAGPPRLTAAGGATAAGAGLSSGASNWALPIGVVQNFNMQQNRQISRFWELGSERSYFIAGRTQAQVAFGRVLYNGPSLLRMMYSFYEDIVPPTLVPTFGVDKNIPSLVANQHNVRLPPGFENIYMNLASDLFSQPCGLLLYAKDSNETTYGAMYLEETYIPSHSIATDAQNIVIQEQVQLMPERVVPIAVRSISLIQSAVEEALNA